MWSLGMLALLVVESFAAMPAEQRGCDTHGEQCADGTACECVSAKEQWRRRLLFGSTPRDCACAAPTKRKYNVLWMLIDDVSMERFPESGNTALEGKLPGFDELKADGAIFYDHLYAPSSICAPAQASLFSGMDPGRIGAHQQFAGDTIEGLRKYKSTPPPEVEFMPEILRQEGYWSTAAGKLDYQVADVIPTFYNEITGGLFVDTLSEPVLSRIARPAVEQNRSFFSMLNLMDNHQFVTQMQRPPPVFLTDPATGMPPADLPFGPMGYSTAASLLFNISGTVMPQLARQVDFDQFDITGYRGAFPERSLSHANKGIPGYLPEDVGIASILAREYDLLRNIDYRLQKIIAHLKELGVYDNTLIMLFGDHGSGTYKAKLMMQLQSMHTPMWVKLPKDVALPSTVSRDSKGHNRDHQLTQLSDLLPTTLSILGIKPPAHVDGRALLGPYASTLPPRDLVFATLNRMSDRDWKTHVAISKDHVYQINQVHGALVEELEDETWFTETVESRLVRNAQYESHLTLFSQAPVYRRLKRLMKQYAYDPRFRDAYKIIAADGATKPPEAFYDRRTDPDAVDNLLWGSTYAVHTSEVKQPWGNTVSSVTVARHATPERVAGDQAIERARMKELLKRWVDGQPHLDWDIDLSAPHKEENRYAALVWPTGEQPVTATPTRMYDAAARSMTFLTTTPGALIRYTVATDVRREQCAQLASMVKQENPTLSLALPGFEAELYETKSGGTRTGFVWNAARGRTTAWSWFLGRDKDCTLFVEANMQFMELACPANGNTYVWDTRDAAWDGDAWVGVDASTGTWTGTPITFTHSDGTINPDAFAMYVLGADREVVYKAGGPKPHQLALNLPGTPPPSYFALAGHDVTTLTPNYFPTPPFKVAIWSVAFSFDTTNQNGMDTKGTWTMALHSRSIAPSSNWDADVSFNSFDYDECMLWEVVRPGVAVTDVPADAIIMAQAVRKGYADSYIAEW